ncbi:Glycosyltransferase family 2 protein [Mycena indigotica]|uniref:chitin synthase n=1 Tax=Mycena indigotica TaxID=2126181 RepID=A0A8H6S598_9AGAR|nr:Glycosyltransferase family 2 protein [Mycena indigotica]KAF7293023.1 Glycosyltransferase family 2 protein [Mycena indigotica]
MEPQHRGERPPRQARPRQSTSQSPAPTYPDPQTPQSYQQRSPIASPPPAGGVTFRNLESGDRSAPLARPAVGAVGNNSFLGVDAEAGVMRKKSLVRPDREKIEPGHRQWHYRTHVAQLEEEAPGRVGVLPSTTGNYPQRQALRRGRSLLAREEDVHESGLALFKRGATLRRKRSSAAAPLNPATPPPKQRSCLGDYAPGPKGPWMLYCYLITACIPTPLMRTCGLRSPEQQRAWREKMGLVSIVLSLMATVGFVTFGFTQAVCGTPPNRFHGGAIGDAFIGKGSIVINGYDYDFGSFHHPRAGSTFDGTTNPLFVGDWGVAGNDASFLFQKTNQNCLGVVSRPNSSQITGTGAVMDWYFPCNVFSQYGQKTPNTTAYGAKTNCHVSSKGQLASMRPQGQVYFTWDDVKTANRSLAVFESSVLDLSLLNWLDPSQITVPPLFNDLKSNAAWTHQDITMQLRRRNQMHLGHCLQDMITVGFIDTNSIGCVASQVLLYLSLIFIVGVVLIRFAMAVMFQWFFSHKLGNFPRETYEERMKRAEEIENWSADIYKPAPSGMRPNVAATPAKNEKRKTFLPSTSRFTPSDAVGGIAVAGKGRPTTAYGHLGSDSGSTSGNKRGTMYAGSIAGSGKGGNSTPPDRRSKSLMSWSTPESPAAHPRGAFADNPCPFPLGNVVPQPPPDYEPFNFPLAHTICLVTAYSESVEGLRTTLDSLATTDYPNSHKLIVIIADGMVKGAGNTLTTPDICLTMMKEFIVSPEDVEAHSYVAIADGHRRHNMAKVYAGFYSYDDATIERSKQQRVPVVLVAKVGNPLEASDAKPGNRGKRDSQIVLMAFLQKVMFDERMTTFEYEFFNAVWRVAGVSPERYELVLCVDADTKVFPDAMSRMVSCMVCDTEIMGLCGETKVANKAETFVTMMQVFEYYISHHMTKSFESMFGGVTCLPGCFSMYRIKAPKGESGFWVPILANPDIVEHYSENVVDTLHKKNLLLLGEDRYLTTLMLKTFPKRKNMFCPQAVCKTTVPDTFRILLSQRRRWINSTIHNLSELILVRDLCGTFCFSMQFVVGMELAGTLVLPAAISFTIYLIVASIIPGHTNTTVPLVLLAFVLGIPLILIVITSRKIAYIGWMLIYLISLPIWNGILPAYAFWHFDDFSWGQTRKVDGGAKDHTGDKEGEFDSSHIVMKRWAEFERERRWRSGTTSREDDDYRWKAESNRYSMASNSDGYHPPSGVDSSTVESTNNYLAAPRARTENNTVLMLPTPLAVSRNTTHSGSSGPTSSSSSVAIARSSEEAFDGNSSAQRLVSSPQNASVDMWVDSFDPPAAPSNSRSPPPRPPRENYRRSLDVSSPPSSANPFIRGGSPASPATYDEPESLVRSPVSAYGIPQGMRGVQLTDSGPVPSADGGVRRVARNSRRPTSQAPVGAGGQGPAPQQQQQQQQQSPQNRYSRNSVGPGASAGWSLPPGAAPPQQQYGGYNGQ